MHAVIEVNLGQNVPGEFADRQSAGPIQSREEVSPR
jgi:hypothetical protein